MTTIYVEVGMNTKLTLSMESEVIERAKRFARSRHRSLSAIVEQYLRFVSDHEPQRVTSSPRIRAISDSLHLPADTDYDELKRQHLVGRYRVDDDSD